MKAFFIFILAIMVTGCAQKFPEFPKDVNTLYGIVIDQNMTRTNCAKLEIVSREPLKYKFIEFVDLSVCQGVVGFTTGDFIKVENWIADAQAWAKSVRCKLK